MTTRPPHVAPGAPLLRQEVFLAAPLAETAMHTKLFGRSEQLDALRAALDAVASGRGRVALVTGEPGIGKSALAGAVVDVAVARGMRTGWGTSDEARAAPALWPLTVAFGDLVAGLDEQVHSHLRARGESIAGLLPQFDDPLAEPRVFDADTATFRLARALAGLLGQIVGPAVVVLDDVQWADEPTLRTVRALLPLISRVPVLFVVTARDTEAQVSPLLDMVLEELSRSARPRLRLPGLGTDDIARFVGAGSIEASTVAALQVQTGGNPFYLGELMAMLAAEQTVPDAETIGALDVPDGVCDIVRRRLVRLPEQVGSYLATAATAGHHFAYDVIAAASGLSADEAATALATARRTGFVVDEGAGGGRFQHGLVRTAIADRVPVTRRRSMHAAIAEALQQVTRSAADAAQIAAHYLAAGPEFAARATMFARAAADAAEKRGALGEAWRNYDVARAAAGTDADHSLLVALARAQKRMGYVREAWATARDAAQAALDAGDVVGAGEAVVTMSADTIWTWREYGEIDYRAIALLDRLIEELPESAAVLRAHVQATAAGELYYWPERAGRAADLAEQACATMRARGGAADLARALELRRLASERPALLADRLATSADLVSLAESRYDESGLGRALIFRGRNRFELGDFASGNSDYERAGRIARRLEVVPVLVVLAWWDAAKLIAAARYAEAEAALARAAELHGRTTMAGVNDLPLLLRASMDIARGTLANSAAQLAALAKASGIAVLADLAELAAQEAGTRHPGAAGVEPAPDYLWLAHQAIRTLILAPRGDCSATRELESALAPYSGRIVIGGTGICILGTVDHYLGLLAASRGDIETAIRRFGAALELARGCGLAAFASATENAIAQLHA
ncbi:MAG TPA: AAA family ATPase [Labilithrix sp.]|nr:AAA family ATPase [Labilithrix sp.]